MGPGSQQLGLGITRQQAIEHSCMLKAPIFQPFVLGQEWSVDVYCSLDSKIKGSVARKRDFIMNGESRITTTKHYPTLENLCREIAVYLNIQGHAVFQVIEYKPGCFQFIECNPRFGGASTASLAVGLDSFYWFFIECLGLHLDDYPFRRSREDIRQVRYMADRLLPWPPSG